MSARTCIAVDSTCDLPARFIEQHNIEVLPIYINHKDGQALDYRDPQAMLQFYKHHNRERYGLAQSDPLSVNDITKILKERLLPKYDLVQVVTINSKKSEVFKRVSEAALINEPKFRELEKNQGRVHCCPIVLLIRRASFEARFFYDSAGPVSGCFLDSYAQTNLTELPS
ncbi:DegV family protein [Cellvibrio japonicus]|uniref:DegV family protein n=1 Tax=Cellvibrio japonicus TaxID=155077 RepID=UPI000325EE74|nr:DegV family protein [Cellvibrio japonicus]